MNPRDPVALMGVPVSLDAARGAKPYHGSDRRALQDGPPHPDARAIGSMVAMHIGQGEWQRAVDVLRSAYEDVRLAAEEAKNDDDPPLSQLGIEPRLCTVLEKKGIVRASDVRRMSDDKLLELRNVGVASLATIRLAVATAAKKRRRAA